MLDFDKVLYLNTVKITAYRGVPCKRSGQSICLALNKIRPHISIIIYVALDFDQTISLYRLLHKWT